MVMDKTLRALRRALPHIQVDNHPYDIGYWMRVADMPLPVPASLAPSQYEIIHGYFAADSELKADLRSA